MFQLFDEKRGRRYALTGLMKEIGRTSECDVCIPEDDRISRVHARLDWDGKNWVLVDLGSTNGSFVNGEQITERKLEVGDVLEVGDTQLRYLPLTVGDVAARKKTTKVSRAHQEDTTQPFAIGKTNRKKT
jgi:pSer/pThr/pTyr-binding forkhead associated (FHA) protein